MAAHDITDAVDVKGRYAVAAVDFHTDQNHVRPGRPDA